jgi:hypothetical protein
MPGDYDAQARARGRGPSFAAARWCRRHGVKSVTDPVRAMALERRR